MSSAALDAADRVPHRLSDRDGRQAGVHDPGELTERGGLLAEAHAAAEVGWPAAGRGTWPGARRRCGRRRPGAGGRCGAAGAGSSPSCTSRPPCPPARTGTRHAGTRAGDFGGRSTGAAGQHAAAGQEHLPGHAPRAPRHLTTRHRKQGRAPARHHPVRPGPPVPRANTSRTARPAGRRGPGPPGQDGHAPRNPPRHPRHHHASTVTAPGPRRRPRAGRNRNAPSPGQPRRR